MGGSSRHDHSFAEGNLIIKGASQEALAHDTHPLIDEVLSFVVETEVGQCAAPRAR